MSDQLQDRSVTKFYIKSFWSPSDAHGTSFPETHEIPISSTLTNSLQIKLHIMNGISSIQAVRD